MVRSRPVGASTARLRAAAVFSVLVPVIALTGTACSDPSIIDGSGRLSGDGTAGITPPSLAEPSPVSSSPVTVSPATVSPGSPTPSPGSSTPLVSPGLALVRELRAASTAVWQGVTDPRTGTGFELPRAVPARTKLQNGISQRLYTYEFTKQSGVSVSYLRTPSAAAATSLLGLYPTQLQQSFRALGVDDAEIGERRSGTVDGKAAVSFRFSFTPTTIPQIPPTWLVTAVAAGADIILAQTVVFPPSTGYDYLRLVRIVQQRLVKSLRIAG